MWRNAVFGNMGDVRFIPIKHCGFLSTSLIPRVRWGTAGKVWVEGKRQGNSVRDYCSYIVATMSIIYLSNSSSAVDRSVFSSRYLTMIGV